MENSIELLVGNMERLYENIYNLLSAFQQASSNPQNSSITVNLKNEDGSVTQQTVNSFQKLQQELTRIDNNYKGLINADNLSYTLEADGSISQQTKTSFINAEYLENFVIGESCVVDKNSIVNDLIYPMVKLPITINSKLISDISCLILEITSGWENIPDNPTLININYLVETGEITYNEIKRTLSLNKQQVKYFGKFNIETLSVSETNNNIYTVILDTLFYTGLYTNGNALVLKTGNILVSKTGASKWLINTIDTITKTINITRISGSESLSVGIEKLYFNEILPTESNIVNVPIKPSQKIIVFLSTENFKNISFPSNGIKIDTTNYSVIYNNQTYTLDEFFSQYVINYSAYLNSLITETTIPASLGIVPTKPILNLANFKVIQINKHVNDAKVITDIETLNKNKQKIQNDINYNLEVIETTNKELTSLKFSSVEEKKYKQNKIETLRQENNTLNTNLLTISKDIDNNAINAGLKNMVPKYSVIGFWPIQTPIQTPLTQAQYIIKYDIQYRYLSRDLDTIESTSFKMIDNSGKSINVVISPWQDLPSKTLHKLLDSTGNLYWEKPLLDSVDDVNINQLNINISENESIEIRIRAVSEAGYPIAPLKSDWSEIMRVDFPLDLRTNNISYTISQNNTDLYKAEFDQILKNYGLTQHINNSFKEGEKTFLHLASDITSGQFTAEQKNISLDVFLSTLYKNVSTLMNNNLTKNVSVKLIDFNSETFLVNNNTTMELFAGNYDDDNILLDSTKWGSIIRKKAYIKIQNENNIPIEIRTLIPGTEFNSTNAPLYYNVPVSNVNTLLQKSKQILYFRNNDLTGGSDDIFKLVIPKKTLTNITPDSSIIDINAQDIDKNLVYVDIDQNKLKICKLKNVYDTNFIAFTTEHPLYNVNELSGLYDNPINILKPEFERLKLYTENLKLLQAQSEAIITDTKALTGFENNDLYSVGITTCGAFLYPIIQNTNKISVIGNTTSSSMILPANSEILIPIVYEYRMIDRIGNINGEYKFNITNVLEYSKKLGIDLYINNEIFKFDINVVSRLKSKVSVKDSINLTSIMSAFNNETPQNLF